MDNNNTNHNRQQQQSSINDEHFTRAGRRAFVSAATNSTRKLPLYHHRFFRSLVGQSPSSSSSSSTTAGVLLKVSSSNDMVGDGLQPPPPPPPPPPSLHARSNVTNASSSLPSSSAFVPLSDCVRYISSSTLIRNSPKVVLPYTVVDYSSFSGTYHPNNIRENKPSDQSSRWSSAAHDHDQYITLRLERPAVACSITFGKFHKAHVCNLKELKVFGGMELDRMTELLHGGLQNNTEPETCSLLYTNSKNMVFPVQYIKIQPLSTFGPNFNYSIWFVQLSGINDSALVNRVMMEYENHKERETIRLCLKHFRQRNMMDIFDTIKSRTGVELEHPLVSKLHREIVVDGNFAEAEELLKEAYASDIFSRYANSVDYKPQWEQIQGVVEGDHVPCGRGGHSMCIDPEGQKIYMFGGWNGRKDLGDFWEFDLRTNAWRLISPNAADQGGPSRRSCHKMCFDPASKSIFVFGQYVDPMVVHNTHVTADFYRYFIEYDHWVKLSDDTAREGGPDLLYDHQMCIDVQSEEIYVFGGRVVYVDSSGQNYGGLYCYSITNNVWTTLREDGGTNNNHKNSVGRNGTNGVTDVLDDVRLRSRVGHSMVFDSLSRSLYIYAGQHAKDYLADMNMYSIDQDKVIPLPQHSLKEAGPIPGFTHRATIDCERQEICVFLGYMRYRGQDNVLNQVWVYEIRKNRWVQVYQKGGFFSPKQQQQQQQPRPRCAHEMVYDPINKVHYIFGGNPGESNKHDDNNTANCRLNDFWRLRLVKPDPADILRHCTLMTRLQKLREMCKNLGGSSGSKQQRGNAVACSKTVQALEYLRSEVVPIVDRSRKDESDAFHKVCADLCLSPAVTTTSENGQDKKKAGCRQDAIFMERSALFNAILRYIPEEMKEPSEQLLDVVTV